MKLKTVLAAPLITAMLFNSLPSFASDTSSAFTTEQEKRIGEIAADYMRAHPDILIQMSETLQQEQQESAQHLQHLSDIHKNLEPLLSRLNALLSAR